jgi:hypothetical protein
MLPDIYTQTLTDNRRALAAWSIGTAAVGVMYAAFYPQVGGSGGMAEIIQNYPEAMREALRMQDIGSAAGYLGSTVFGLLLPLLVMAFGVTFGARAVAGDEETGYLDLLLAHPVGRTRLAVERFAGLVTAPSPSRSWRSPACWRFGPAPSWNRSGSPNSPPSACSWRCSGSPSARWPSGWGRRSANAARCWVSRWASGCSPTLRAISPG